MYSPFSFLFQSCHWNGDVSCPPDFMEEVFTDMGMCVLFNNKTNFHVNKTGKIMSNLISFPLRVRLLLQKKPYTLQTNAKVNQVLRYLCLHGFFLSYKYCDCITIVIIPSRILCLLKFCLHLQNEAFPKYKYLQIETHSKWAPQNWKSSKPSGSKMLF